MQYVPFEEGIEVNGQTVVAVIEGFALFKKIPSDILIGVGIGKRGPGGMVEIRPGEWFSQRAWLEGFEAIGNAVGTGALYGIGLKIPECAEFPPWVNDVHSAVRSIDIAYHLNHRKRGHAMFDATTGEMLEGIGHYGYMPVAGENRILSICQNPYPCDFDSGIITAMARRFAPDASVEHVESETCRKTGADKCTYLVTWR
jgi:hypothetical protein